MTARPSSRRLAVLLLAGVGAASLSACGMPARQSAAAVVNGTTISAEELDGTIRDLAKINPQIKTDDPTIRGQVLSNLIQAPFVIDEAKASGKFSEAGTYAKVTQELPDAGTGIKKIALLASIADGQSNPKPLDQADVDKIQAEIAKAEIHVNPQYGTLDPKTMTVVQETPSWIADKPAADSSPMMQQDAPQQDTPQ